MLIHIAKGYLGERHGGVLYLMGRVCEPATYAFEPGDIFLPDVGGGIIVPEELRTAILERSISGRLVPYYMLQEPIRVVDEEEIHATE